MKTYLILFLIGKDRPGIVDELSTYLYDRGANIEDSRMAAMGGRFSAMTLFSCEPEQADVIRDELDALRVGRFEASLHEAVDPAELEAAPRLPIRIEVTAVDHPGIVRDIVRLLHNNNVNIETLNSQVIRAPLSGAPLFDLTIQAAVPADRPVSRIKAELAVLADELNLDLTFGK